jgi:hypothetical protein
VALARTWRFGLHHSYCPWVHFAASDCACLAPPWAGRAAACFSLAASWRRANGAVYLCATSLRT